MLQPHVLVISTAVDTATDVVERAIHGEGGRVTRINTEDFPFDATLTTSLRSEAVSAFCVTGPGGTPEKLAGVTAVWYRRVRIPVKPPDMHPGVYDFALRESRAALLGMVLAHQVPMMSPPAHVWAAEQKVYQLAQAREAGLSIPATIITNDPEEVKGAFSRFHGGMIAKPVRTGFVDYGDEQHAVYTSRVLEEHLDGVAAARLSPSIYQPLIEKKCDVRATLVGKDLFVAEIDSQTDPAASVDWRKTTNPLLPHRRAELPIAVEAALRTLAARLGLLFGAFDLIRTPDDEYVFLEVNPNGQWLWLDDMLGFDISGAVARWLMRVP
jgi:glutathione synthase/RimK-type ligase-like ATP-grasp enzyme